MDYEREAMLESALVESERTQKDIDDEIKKKKEKQVINNKPCCCSTWRISLIIRLIMVHF